MAISAGLRLASISPNPGTRSRSGAMKRNCRLPLQVVHAGLPRHAAVEAGVNARDAQSQRRELGRLVFHQRNQRRDHQRRAAQRNRRQLIAERLAKARRHHQQQIAPVNCRAADRLLIRPEARKAKDRLQQFSQLNLIGRRIRFGWSRQEKKAQGAEISAKIARSTFSNFTGRTYARRGNGSSPVDDLITCKDLKI